MIAPKDVYKDANKKESGALTKDELDSGSPKNGPPPKDGIQFENKNLLLYYRR